MNVSRDLRAAGRRAAIGRLLDGAGRLGLPFAAGLGAGYWIADRGARWLPDVLAGLLLLVLVSSLLMATGFALRRRLVTETAAGLRVRKRLVALSLLVAVALGARLAVWWAEQPSPLTRLAPAERRLAFAIDVDRYRELERSLELLVRRLEADPRLSSGGDRALLPDEEELLLEAWVAAHDQAFALDQVRLFWEDWYRFDASRVERAAHVQSFLLTFAAELALYEKGLRLVRVVAANPTAERFLDAPHPAQGLAAGSFGLVRRELQGSRDEARVLAGAQYLAWLGDELGGRDEAERLGLGWLWNEAEQGVAAVFRLDPKLRARLRMAGDLQPVRSAVRRTWFPAQQGVAAWMGDVRTRRVGRYLITREQLAVAATRLAPGDVLLSRKNWYLSNVGLPGFWPHAILYLGTPDELAAAFDTPEVRAWARAELGDQAPPGVDLGLPELLARRHPALWRRYLAGAEGEPYRVVEAISEGVVLNTLPHATGDYLAALRPRVPALSKAQAIARAFAHLEKPYDFDFDFATDHALVCTELVWRSYRATPGGAGLVLPVAPLAGRQTLPANEIARLYADERGRPDRQLDFVLFLDAREREGRAVVADEAAFAASHRRLKWDVAQR
jgi:hypothetical protein